MKNIDRDSTKAETVGKLCPPCGLCCNGALFGDVELQKSDNAKKLAALGLPLQRMGNKTRFLQPCACFKDNLCTIYADRPSRCRAFECRLLQKVQAGNISVDTALKAIQRTRQINETVLRLLRELGNAEELLPLNRRCSQVMSQPVDLSRGKSVDIRGELMMAVNQLVHNLERNFLC